MSFTIRVTIGLVAGLLLGFAVFRSHSPRLMRLPDVLDPIGVIFVNAIRLTVIPIVVSSLIVGVASSGDVRRVSRLGVRALALILVTLMLAALFAGAIALPLLGRLNIDKNLVARLSENATAHETVPVSSPSVGQWLADLVPTNVLKAAADGALLPLIVISVAFGLALTQIEHERRVAVVGFFHGIADAFLVLVRYIVRFAPIGVFALALSLGTRMGAAAAEAFAFYIALLSAIATAFMVVVLYPAAVVFGRVPLSRFVKAAVPAQAVTFASQSSLAALPAVYEGVRTVLALPEDVYDFFLPLAASMFRVGGAMVQVVGILFLAKLYGVALSPEQLATVVVMAVVTSMTIPGVPGGGIIVMSPVLTMMNLPASGIGILLAVDTIPDMFRSTANVTGWLCVISILSRDAAATSKVAAQPALTLPGG